MALVYTRPASGDVAYHEAFAARAPQQGGAARGGVQGLGRPGRQSRRLQRIEVFSMASRACRSRASSISRVTSSG